MRFGVDTGGTFTDVVARDADGGLHVHKLLSTPSDPSEAIASGVFVLCDAPTGVVHGTTVATNALLEGTGCRVAFVTTQGFEDLLILRRQNRPQLYALDPEVVEPLTRIAVGARERVLATGDVHLALTDGEVGRVVNAVRAAKPEAVAICLLHAYANDGHERRLADALREAMPELHVTASSQLAPEFREYERASTTVVNAYIGPTMARYIDRLGRRLAQDSVEVLLSSGGRASLERASREPVHTVLSGPAGGVVGAFAAAADLGIDRILTFDMGGTSTDVSLCDGEPRLTFESEIAGFPLKIPALDILTVGAGGGSIASIDAGGALRVGPESAGALPGPAAYGRGGIRPTVTDAHVVLGSLRPEAFLGGGMSLDVDASYAAVARVAEQACLDVAATARGILDVADAAMARTIKVICSRHGRDPRDFALVSFGGAGGLHACRLAEALMIDTVVVPAHPGLLSAYGMLHALKMRLASAGIVAPLAQPILERFRGSLRKDVGEAEHVEFTAAVRYRGQAHELEVSANDHADAIARRFAERHRELFGYDLPDGEVELVALRGKGTSKAVDTASAAPPAVTEDASYVVTADLGRGPETTEVLARDALKECEGPAIITEYSGTTVLLAGWKATAVGRHLVLRRIS